MNIVLVGASGVIGRPLLKLLRDAGHTVTGTTRTPQKTAEIEALGARAVVVDVYDAAALREAMLAAKPDVVINQLTDLPDARDPAQIAASRAGNARVRTEGTRNVMAAAKAAGARRAIAQSIAFVYAPGQGPLRETDPLDESEAQRVTVDGVLALERQTLQTPGIEGIVLRYGRLYGPGTWFDAPGGPGPLTTDAAAYAALLAVTRGAPGIYNIAEDDGTLSIEKARRELGFDPGFGIMDEEPKNLADILRALPKGTPLLLPDELLGLWFPPGIVGGVLDPRSRKSAEEYAAHFNCLFSYMEDQHQGCFAKQISN